MEQRLAWIEASRTLACALVVLVHVNIHIRAGMETWWPGGFAGAPVLALSVPTFFIIAGYIADLGSGDRRRTAPEQAARLRRLLVPFFTWNALTLLALTFDAGFLEGSPVLQLLTGTWHLYFIFALVQLLVLHQLLQPWLSSRLTWVLAGGLACTVLGYALSEAILWMVQPGDGSFEVNGRKPFFVWTGFFVLGVWWRRHGLTPASHWSKLLSVAMAVGYAGYLADLHLENGVFGFTPRKQLLLGGLPFQLLGALGLLMALQWWDATGRGRRLLAALGRPGIDTFGIYLSHIVVLLILWSLWDGLGLVRMLWVEVPLFTLATWAGCRALVQSTRALGIPWLSLALLGETTPRAREPVAAAAPSEPQFTRGTTCARQDSNLRPTA